ncbi:hypothetical protein [Pseudoduganella lurida]|nr:hypothetical protein [Pseudoduganella lurida]
MPSQTYRGHVVEVHCHLDGGRICYRCSICVAATGELRHEAVSDGECFVTDSAAQDHAFQAARAWIEHRALRWPFASPADGSG